MKFVAKNRGGTPLITVQIDEAGSQNANVIVQICMKIMQDMQERCPAARIIEDYTIAIE